MRSLFVTALMAGLAFGVWKWTRHHEAKKRAAMFAATAAADARAAEAPPPALPEWRGFLGVVLTGETVEVASKGEGRLEEIFVKPGDHIKRGEPIAQLDVRTQREDLRIAEAQLHEAHSRYARRAPLLRGGGISGEELSETRSNLLQAEARVRQLQQALTEARVVAPFDGVIAAKYFDVGAVVAPGRPIVRLLGKSDPKVRFAITEDKVADVSAGGKVRVHLDNINADVDGVIDSVNPEVDAGTRLSLGTAKLTVPEALQSRLSTGQVAWVRGDKPRG
jgi:RND family efflux transporter MFP subunit